jgi:hypothetical protein
MDPYHRLIEERVSMEMKTIPGLSSMTTSMGYIEPPPEWDKAGAKKRGEQYLAMHLKKHLGKDIPEAEFTRRNGWLVYETKDRSYRVEDTGAPYQVGSTEWGKYPAVYAFKEQGELRVAAICKKCKRVLGAFYDGRESYYSASAEKEYPSLLEKRCMGCKPWTEKELAEQRRDVRKAWLERFSDDGVGYDGPLTALERLFDDSTPDDFNKAEVAAALKTVRDAIKQFRP